MFLFMPVVTPVTCRLAATVAVDGLNVTAVFVEGAPPGQECAEGLAHETRAAPGPGCTSDPGLLPFCPSKRRPDEVVPENLEAAQPAGGPEPAAQGRQPSPERRLEPPAGPGRAAAGSRTLPTQPLDPTTGTRHDCGKGAHWRPLMLRDLPYIDALPEDRRARHLMAAALRAGSRALDRLALRAGPCRSPEHVEPLLEFYAEAGAPEGALYVDGRLVGILAGVNRL